MKLARFGIYFLTIFYTGHCSLYDLLLSKSEDVQCANAISRFGMSILKISAKNGNANVMFSPWNIAMSLGNVYTGAKGMVKSQLSSSVFYGIKTDKDLHKKVSQLMNTLSAINNKQRFVLKSANMLFIANHVQLEPKYIVKTREYLRTRIFRVNFEDSEEAVGKINSEIKTKTAFLKNVVPKNFFDENKDTKLVLVSAMCFTGNLAPKFRPSRSYDGQFSGVDGRLSTVRMMKTYESDIFYKNNKEVEFVGLPYRGGKLVLYIVIPKGMTLPDFEQSVSHKKLMNWFCGAKTKKVMVNIPQLMLMDNFEFSDVMKKLGMGEMFTETSDLSRMYYNNTVNDGLFSVSSIIHSALLQVSESDPSPSGKFEFSLFKSISDPEFTADRPFLFTIVETTKKAMLFLGHYFGPPK